MAYSYLAIGDSYTIGEKVLLQQSFPYKTVQLLRTKNSSFYAPEIIAKTGFTTDELLQVIAETQLLDTYDFVTLLIGVNNQYRNYEIAVFESEFEQLLKFSLQKAGNNANNVFVLSIPDWGLTPFAKDRDTAKISIEIDAYNKICKTQALQYHCKFIDITTQQRADSNKLEMIAEDELHPSGIEYSKWANMLAEAIVEGCLI